MTTIAVTNTVTTTATSIATIPSTVAGTTASTTTAATAIPATVPSASTVAGTTAGTTTAATAITATVPSASTVAGTTAGTTTAATAVPATVPSASPVAGTTTSTAVTIAMTAPPWVLRACSLPVCVLHDHRAARIFVAEHIDGAGHRLRNILEGMAVAERNGLNFGGVWAKGPGWYRTEHGHDFRSLTDRFFGGNASKELFQEEVRGGPAPIDFAAKFESVRDLERARGGLRNFSNIFLPSSAEWSYNSSVPTSEYFTPRLLAAFRRQLARRPLAFAPGRLAVAVHVRRGDLGSRESRALPDKYFYATVKRIRALQPLADVHVWSSTWPFWNSSAFDGYRRRNMTVHLDDHDLMDPWAHLSRAGVLVSSPSNFAVIPAMLNPFCVIDSTGAHNLFTQWMKGFEQGRASYNKELAACVARATTGP